MQIRAKEIAGVSTQGDDMVMDLESVDIEGLLGQLKDEVDVETILDLLDFSEIAEYLADRRAE